MFVTYDCYLKIHTRTLVSFIILAYLYSISTAKCRFCSTISSTSAMTSSKNICNKLFQSPTFVEYLGTSRDAMVVSTPTEELVMLAELDEEKDAATFWESVNEDLPDPAYDDLAYDNSDSNRLAIPRDLAAHSVASKTDEQYQA